MADGNIQVSHYWRDRNLHGQRCWDFLEKPDQMNMADWDAFQEEILNHFIEIKEGLDILRWGYTNKGTFNIKEAYNI